LYKNKIKLESAEKIIDLVCQSTNDEEHKNRITVLHNTYRKGDAGAPIAGYSSLIDALTRVSDECNAHSILKIISQTLNKYRNPILSQLDSTVVQELSRHSFEILSYNPINFVIAHSEKKQILRGKIAELSESKEQYVHYNNVIINAIPTKITRYENPSNIEIKYEVEFETPTGQSLKIQPANLEEILGYLKINGLVYKIRAAEEALPAILNAYYREGKMTVKREIETPGFYLIDNKIEAYKAEHKQPTEEEIRKCTDLLISLQSKYRCKEVFPTFLKWGIMSPFSYILKQIDGEQWMPWLFPYGWTNTGKTTNGKIVLAIWRKHKDKTKHDIGFSAADNVARFARAISYNTYPVLINEVQLNDDRQKQLVETLKHAVQSQTARARLMSRSVAEYISALSPCILTSNDLPPQDPAFRRRIIPIYYSKEDAPSQQEIDQFNSLLRTELDTLGILGDFAANYILENQEILVNGKSNWIDIAKLILVEFFKAAGQEVPDWIEYFAQETQVQDAALEQEQIVRGFFVKAINEAFSRNYRVLTPREDVNEVINKNTIERRLDFCCEMDLIPFLRRKDGCILIFHDIMHELKNHRINSIIHLTQLARMFQSEVKPMKLDGKPQR
ncbi:MAG: hypothetical protein WA631_13955, partial [Nitrososphaeraceae archaeon]